MASPLKRVAAKLESDDCREFEVSRTLVAQNIWYRENEDLQKVMSTILHKALKIPKDDVKIVCALRKSGKKTGSGLVKIELESAEQVKKVLSKKRDLKMADVREIREVYLRQSKREEVLVMECNMDTILRDMGVRDDYVCVASGHLVKKCVMGLGRGRGGGGGYGSRNPPGRGPSIGIENVNDARVAQANYRRDRASAVADHVPAANHTMTCDRDCSIDEFMG